MDYNEIVTAVKDYSKRKNITDATISGFIELALSRANWALRIPAIEESVTLEVSAAGQVQIPKTFVEAKELHVVINGKAIVLDRKSISEVNSMNNTTGTTPCIFGRFGNYFNIAPWNLGEGYYSNLYFYSALPPLSVDNTNNWFTDYATGVLLYGALEALCDYTRDTEGSALWQSKFTNEINILQAVEDNAEWAGSTIAITPSGSIRERNS